MTPVRTARLLLRPFTPDELMAAIEGDDALAQHMGMPVAPGWLEFPEALPYFLEDARSRMPEEPWAAYAYIGASGEGLIGSGGFKGAPDHAGVCEIGYGLAPAFRGRGLATEAAQALVALAFAQPQVRVVTAHTLPEPNPSTRVLERAGFAFEGTVDDPHDGTVWRWRHGPPPAVPTPS